MVNKVIPHGITADIATSLTPADTLSIEGGLAGGGAGGTGIVAAAITNAGLISLGGGAGTPAGFAPGGAGGTLANAGSLDNLGVLMLAGGKGGGASGFYGQGGAGSCLSNAGTLSNEGSLTIGAGGPGQGYISGAGTGAVLVNGGVLANTGAIAIEGGRGGTGGYASGGTGGTLSDAGVLANSGRITVSGGAGGSYALGNEFPGYGGQLSVSGSLSNSGEIALLGGTNDTGDQYPIGGATLNVSGTLSNTGRISLGGGAGFAYGAALLVGGVLANSGRISLAGGTGGHGGYPGTGGSLNDAGLLINAGTIAVGGGVSGGGASLIVSGVLIDGGVIRLGPGASAGSGALAVTPDGRLELAGGRIGGPGLLDNSGTIAGAGTIAAGQFENMGLVIADGGVLLVGGPVTSGPGQGWFAVMSGATLSLNGTVTGQESVALADVSATLRATAASAGLRVWSPHWGTLQITGGGTAALNGADGNLTVKLVAATDVVLSRMRFVTAIGSNGGDAIAARQADQSLTGGLGTDTLTGAAATGDTFRDSAAGLNGDRIVNFAGSDIIDVTDIAAGPALQLGYQQNGSTGTLSVANGGRSTEIGLSGSFAAGQFQTNGDGHGGVLIHLGR